MSGLTRPPCPPSPGFHSSKSWEGRRKGGAKLVRHGGEGLRAGAARSQILTYQGIGEYPHKHEQHLYPGTRVVTRHTEREPRRAARCTVTAASPFAKGQSKGESTCLRACVAHWLASYLPLPG